MRAGSSDSRPAAQMPGRGLSIPGCTITVVALSLAAWLGTLVLMRGMDAGPGTPLHRLPAFLVGWIVMLTAMMLPSELNYIGAFITLLRARDRAPATRQHIVANFIAGCGIAWIAYGLAAWLLDTAVRSLSSEWLAWNRAGPYLTGSVLLLAGLYQVSPLKHACLRGCRSPIAFFARHWREGHFGAIAMGVRHGLVCVGCCWALMGVMFAVGAMSLRWMALLTVFMFAEKMLPQGRRLTLPIACFLWIVGSWVALSPTTAPLLEPTHYTQHRHHHA